MNNNKPHIDLNKARDMNPYLGLPKEISSRMKTIKVDIRTWDSLKSMKKENETFNDVVKNLLQERTKSIGDENIKAILYKRKKVFFTSRDFRNDIGYEFEYNEIKNTKQDFVLDLKIKKIFYGKSSYPPSQFFGLDNVHKHFSNFFLLIYLKAVELALRKEFRIGFISNNPSDSDYENLALWRKKFYDYNLSEESFIEDIEKPLNLSEKEEPSSKWKNKMASSIFSNIKREYEDSVNEQYGYGILR